MLIDREEFFTLTGGKSIIDGLQKISTDPLVRKRFKDFQNITLSSRVLFHGSSKVLETLELNVSDGGSNENREDALIYATDHPEYAIFLSVIDIQETGRAGVSFKANGTIDLYVNKEFMDGPSRFVEGYVHILDASGFTEQKDHEFTIDKSIQPFFCIRVGKDDLDTKISTRETGTATI